MSESIVQIQRGRRVTQVIAIDPGNERSALVCYDGRRVTYMTIAPNADIVDLLERTDGMRLQPPVISGDALVIEQIESFGMAVGKTVFETVYWSGRFHQAWLTAVGEPVERITRRAVKLHLCNSSRAKDANVRQALIDRFGPGKALAVGLKKTPGPLYGVKTDMWSALAVAVTWWETLREVDVS